MVIVRSYSRSSGSTSEDSDTGTPGSTSAASAPMRRSWAGSAKELISETASASIPVSFASCARTSASSSSRITVPSEAMRSSTSTVFSSAARGSGLGQMIQPASPPGT